MSAVTTTTFSTASSDAETCASCDLHGSYLSNECIHSQSSMDSVPDKRVITISLKKLNTLMSKLHVARVNITPLVDLILEAASSCSEFEFKEKIRKKEPVCCVQNAQYIRAFQAAEILRDVNNELIASNEPGFTRSGFREIIVNTSITQLLNNSNLAATDTIYIDRDTMKQLLELHEIVTDTIEKLQKAERIKKGKLQNGIMAPCSSRVLETFIDQPKIADIPLTGKICVTSTKCTYINHTPSETCICDRVSKPKEITPITKPISKPSGDTNRVPEAKPEKPKTVPELSPDDIKKSDIKPTKGMQPNKNQDTVSPSDTILRNFIHKSREMVNKSQEKIKKVKKTAMEPANNKNNDPKKTGSKQSNTMKNSGSLKDTKNKKPIVPLTEYTPENIQVKTKEPPALGASEVVVAEEKPAGKKRNLSLDKFRTKPKSAEFVGNVPRKTASEDLLSTKPKNEIKNETTNKPKDSDCVQTQTIPAPTPYQSSYAFRNVGEAKFSLIQCLAELTKIRKFLKGCNDKEIHQLEESINVQIVQHDVNCDKHDAHHIHCDVQGVSLILLADKNIYDSTKRKDVPTKDASTATEKEKAQKENIVIKNAAPVGPICDKICKDRYLKQMKANAEETQTGSSNPSFFSAEDGTQTIEHTKDQITNTEKQNKKPNKNENNAIIQENTDKFIKTVNNAGNPENKTIEEQASEPVSEPKNRNGYIINYNHVQKKNSYSGMPYVVGVRSLPEFENNINLCPSMVITVESMRRIMQSEEIYHRNPSVNEAIRSIDLDDLLLSCTPADCCLKTTMNDRRDRPELPLKASLASLPLSATDLVVIHQNVERKSNTLNDYLLRQSTYNPFEYYTNFQENFSSNRHYFVPRVYLVYYFEFLRTDNDVKTKKKTQRTRHVDEDADSDAERKWSDFKLFDYLRKEFQSLRGDGLSPKSTNAINIKTSKNKHNKKIQVSLTKTFEVPNNPKRNRLENSQLNLDCGNSSSCTQESEYISRQSNNQIPPQLQRTLRTQTISTSTNSLANFLLDTIYENEPEYPFTQQVQNVYTLPQIIRRRQSKYSSTSLLEQLHKPPSRNPKLNVETNQFEVRDTCRSNHLVGELLIRRSSERLVPSAETSKDRSSRNQSYRSFIPRRMTATMDGAKSKSTAVRSDVRANASTTRINDAPKDASKETATEASKQTLPYNLETLKRTKSPIMESSSDTEDILSLQKGDRSLSKSKLSNFKQNKTQKRSSVVKNKHNIVRDKIKHLTVYNSETLGPATMKRNQSFASPAVNYNATCSQVLFGCGSDNNAAAAAVASSVFNLPKKHSCGFLSVLSPTCGCPDVTVFIPCFCSENNCSGHGQRKSDSLDILSKGVSGMYHVIMPPTSVEKFRGLRKE